MDQRFAPGNGYDRRPALLDCTETLFYAETPIEDLLRIADLPATGAGNKFRRKNELLIKSIMEDAGNKIGKFSRAANSCTRRMRGEAMASPTRSRPWTKRTGASRATKDRL